MSSAVNEITFATAIRDALAEEMRYDERVVLFGEDTGKEGGVFKVTQGIYEEFGPERVRDTPISEIAMTGLALGAALNGLRPVLDLMFFDFVAVAYDQVVNQIAKFSYQSGGQIASLPLVIRAASGAGVSFGAQHSQSVESWLMQAPGLKIVTPSNPRDAKGLLKAAIRDDGPVCFFEHKLLYRVKGEVGADEVIPLGQATVVREGRDLTIVASGLMVTRVLEAAALLADVSIDAEVVDLRCTVPLDRQTVADSLEFTGRLLTVEEAPGGLGWSAELLAWALEEGHVDSGKARRVAPPRTPVPYSPVLEEAWLPSPQQIVETAKVLMSAR